MRKPLVFRCFARRTEGLWVAMCIDLTLAVQGDTLDEVKAKLGEQITEYVHTALTVDHAYAEQLLSRVAPWRYRAEYHAISLLIRLARLVGANGARKEDVFQRTPDFSGFCAA